MSIREHGIQLDFTYLGKRYRPTISGLKPNIKSHLKQAESIMIQMQADMARNDFDILKYFPNYKGSLENSTYRRITIKEELYRYLNLKDRELEKTTLKGYKSAIDAYLVPVFGNMYLSELKTADVRSWINSLTISNKRINNILIPLRAIYQIAYIDELIESNPLDRIPNLKVKTEKVTPFTPELRDKILDSCEGQIKNLLQFAFWTGLRTSEFIALDWDDINLINKTAYIHKVRTSEGNKSSTKTASSTRTITLLPEAINALLNQKEINSKGTVFLNPKTQKVWRDDQSIRKIAWIPTLQKANIKYRKPYTTRHTYASILLSMGMSPMWVSTEMGHTDWGQIRQTYGKFISHVDKTHDTIIKELDVTCTSRESQHALF